MKTMSCLLKGGFFLGSIFVVTASAGIAAEVDFSRYFKSSISLSAVASAVSILEPCESPIKFSEKVEAEDVTLAATCAGSDAITVKVHFQRDESGNLFPDSFDYGE